MSGKNDLHRHAGDEGHSPLYMRWHIMILLIAGLAGALIGPSTAEGQVDVTVSDVVERHDGETWFMHTVERGQTYYSIARAYQISVERLRRANPQNGDVLRAGAILRIPVTADNASLMPDMSGEFETSRRLQRTEPGSRLPAGQLTALEVMNLEHRVDEVLTRALNRHFDPGRYLLDVTIDVSTRYYEQEVPVRTSREQPRQFDEQLPGLPFIPPALLRNRESDTGPGEGSMELREVHVPEIDRFHVVLRVDTLFSESDLDLMREIITSKVHLDPDQEDRLELIRQPFRTHADSLGVMAERPENEVAMAERPATSRYFYLLLAGIIMLGMLLSLLMWYLTVFLPRRQERESALVPFPGTGAERTESQGDSGVGSRLPDKVQPANDEKEEPAASPRHYLMQMILRYPEQIGRLFTYWYEREGEHGLQRAASILMSVDPKLIALLRDFMPADALRELGQLMRSPKIRSASIRKEVFLQQFADELRTRRRESGDVDDLNIMSSFDFLYHLEDRQLLEVLKDENARSKALAICHLPDERKSRLLQEFGLDEAGGILYYISQIRYIAFHEYERTANRLFDKSYRLKDKERAISERDIDQIVSIIEALPASDQEKYIRQLDYMVSDLANEVRKRVITMERIVDLDNDILEEAVDMMSRQELAAVLVGTGEELRTRLLQFRPQKEEELIREEINEMVYLSRDEIDRTRGKLLKNLRKIRNRKKRTEKKSGSLTEGMMISFMVL